MMGIQECPLRIEKAMIYEMLVGLHVTDDEQYNKYREAMAPILQKYGGAFSYDFKVGEELKNSTNHQINRVFTIYFPSEKNKDDFFANGEYLMVKEKFYVGSVTGTTILASYER